MPQGLLQTEAWGSSGSSSESDLSEYGGNHATCMLQAPNCSRQLNGELSDRALNLNLLHIWHAPFQRRQHLNKLQHRTQYEKIIIGHRLSYSMQIAHIFNDWWACMGSYSLLSTLALWSPTTRCLCWRALLQATRGYLLLKYDELGQLPDHISLQPTAALHFMRQ